MMKKHRREHDGEPPWELARLVLTVLGLAVRVIDWLEDKPWWWWH